MKNIALLMAIVGSLSVSAAEKQATYKIRWLLAHEPIGIFQEAAEAFSKEVAAKTGNDIAVEVLTLSEYKKKYNNNKKMKTKDVADFIEAGKAEMSQTYTTDLGRKSQEMYVLDLPFLFRDHAHAQKVLEGDVGNNLLAGLRKSNIEGLAFTYSGGFRVMPGTKKIEKFEDFKGMKIRTSNSPIAQETFNMIGAKAVPMPLNKIEEGIKSHKIEIAESTYPRYYSMGQNNVARVMNETNHSLFLTSIILNEDFYKKLPENYKKIVKDAAMSAARVERNTSIASGEEIKVKCKEDGVQLVTMSKEEEARFKTATRPVYTKFESLVGKNLISSIENQ